MELRSPLTLQPYDYIGDPTGRPLDKGQIYIGVAGQDPEFYPTPVYLDAEMTKPVDQPIRTNDGFVDFAGSLSELYASGEIYSVKILDKEGRTILYKGDMTRKNLMSDALSDLNQSIIDAQSAAQAAIDDTVNNASIVITNVSTDATAAIDNAVLISNDAASRADSAINTLFETGGLPASPFETKALMIASSLPNGAYAVVTNDTASNIGIYLKKSGAWTLTPWNNFKNLDSLSINRDKNYPFKVITRDSMISISENNALILGCTVYNAEPDYYYAIRYYRNGYTADGGSGNGWIVSKHPKSTYSSASVEMEIIGTDDGYLMPELVRDGIQTIFLQSPRSSELLKITIDTSQLKPLGTWYAWNKPSSFQYSWIIDPSNYVLSLSTKSSAVERALVVSLTDNALTFAYASVGRSYRITIKPNGYNNLPNIAKIEANRADNTLGWYTLQEQQTDWLPPLRALAINNSDATYTEITTGGNHGKDGGEGGGNTARNVHYAIEIDGVIHSDFDGYADNIRVTIVNEVMAMNTVSTDRYVVRECFLLNINKEGVVSVNCDRRALEDIQMTRDRGLQCIGSGFNQTYLVTNGATKYRAAVGNNLGSGVKSLAPNANAIVFQGFNNQLSMSIDKYYGLGDGSYVADTEQLFFYFGKGYSAIIADSPLSLAKGKGYQWRGAYHIKAIADKPTLADSQFDSYVSRFIAYDADDVMVV